MLILPAIDIKQGKVVRLIKGDFNKETVYFEKPEAVALMWQKQGAEILHVIDLDGAATGKMKNINAIKKILENVDIPIQVGGGIRTFDDIKRVNSLGVERIILSTAAYNNKDLLKTAVSEFGNKISVSIDAKDNQVMIKGWKKASGINLFDFAKDIEDLGVKTVIYTDIRRDGTLSGVNINNIKDFLTNTNLSVIASGGISSLDDLRRLKKLRSEKLKGAIIGKALYDKRISLYNALEV